MQRMLWTVMFLTIGADAAGAQVLDRPRGDGSPRAWISGAVGWYDAGNVDDGATGSSWRFSGAAQFRGSLEYALGGGNTIGASASYARVPLRYGTALTVEDATATVSSLLLTFHGGAGPGLHRVIEISAGAVRYSDFTSDEDGRRVAPLEADLDFAFLIGGGFGYSLGSRAQVVLVQEFGLALHQSSGLPNDASTSAYQRTTRLGLRYGIGGGRR